LILIAIFTSQTAVAQRKPAPAQSPKTTTEPPVINTRLDLWTKGTVLRGANIWQKIVTNSHLSGNTSHEVKCDGDSPEVMETNYLEGDFRELKGWNANYVNISFPAPYSQTPFADGKYHPAPCVLQRLRDLVNLAENFGLFVVIGFRTGPGRSERQFSEPDASTKEEDSPLVNELFQTQPGTNTLTPKAIAAQNAWIAAWRMVADAFKERLVVAGYELLIEPGTRYENNGTDTIDVGRRQHWFNLAQRLAAAIRNPPQVPQPPVAPPGSGEHTQTAQLPASETIPGAGDRDTPILIGGWDYGNVEALLHIDPTAFGCYEPVVFTAHQYQPDRYTHQEGDNDPQCPELKDKVPDKFNECTKQIVRKRISWMDAFKTDHRGVALAVTEFGIKRGVKGAPDFLPFEMALLENEKNEANRSGVNHALWLWQPATHDSDKSFDFRASKNSDLIRAIREDWGRNKIWAIRPLLDQITANESAAHSGR
jgi:hypothetical protein